MCIFSYQYILSSLLTTSSILTGVFTNEDISRKILQNWNTASYVAQITSIWEWSTFTLTQWRMVIASATVLSAPGWDTRILFLLQLIKFGNATSCSFDNFVIPISFRPFTISGNLLNRNEWEILQLKCVQRL